MPKPSVANSCYGTSAKTITNATTNKRYCFSVKDQAGNTGYGGVNVNLTAPVISLTQDQNSVDATATMAGDPTVDTASWAHSDVLTSDPTCSEATYNTAGSSENTAPVDSGDDGDWVCFKVANSLGVYSYAEWTIDFTAPTVTVAQSGSTLTASATDAGVGLGASPVFKHTAALNTTATCNSSQTYGTSAKTITNATTNKRYCFSVKDQAGNTGYGGVNVNLAAPVISLTQDQNSVDATATMAGDPTIDTASWAHSDVLTSDPTCSEATYNTAGSSENTAPVDSGDDGDYICFKVANSLGVYSYAEWTIDFTAPTVTVAQNGSTLTASATDAGVGLGASPVFKHTAALNTTAICNSSQTYGTSAKTITNATTNKRYCFSVKDQAGNTGYGGVNVNLTAPVISLTQDQNSVDATATMAGDPTIDTASWAHSDVLTSDPTCSEATYNTAGSSENTAPVDSGDDGDYICFKVANSLGVYSYAEWTIDFTAPTVTVAQNGSTLTASATDAGVGLGASPVFKHTAALNTTATCNSSQTYGTSAKTITNATTNKRYCFSVKDQAGNTGYGGVNVNLTAPVISLTQDQNSVDATATMAGDPTIDTASWAHSDVLTSDPTCSEATYNTAGSSENTAPVDSGDDGDYICFKVANSLGVYSYAEWTIDFTAPTVTVAQSGSTLTASATDAGVGLGASPVFKHTAALNTTAICNSSQTYGTSAKTITNATTNKRYCFSVKDQAGNTGYGGVNVNLTAPVISLPQDQNSVDATATMAGDPQLISEAGFKVKRPGRQHRLWRG